MRILDRWDNYLRASTDCSVVQRTAIVGTAARDLTDLAGHAPHKIHADVAVINPRINQSLTDDHASAVDTEMQLLPTTNAFSAVLDDGPLTFAEDGEPAAVDDQINPAKLLRHP